MNGRTHAAIAGLAILALTGTAWGQSRAETFGCSPEMPIVRRFPASEQLAASRADRVAPLDLPGRREIIAGAVLFGASYTATALFGAFTWTSPMATYGALSFVPIVGSAVWMGHGFALDPGFGALMLADTAAQIAGMSLLISGLVHARTVWRHDDVHASREMMIVPSSSPGFVGLTLFRAF
jgi:hypothetical protein